MATPSLADVEAVAGSNFGNKEAITATEFGTPGVNANPTQPDFVSEGKIIANQAIAAATPFTSKTVKITSRPDQSTIKTVYVQSDVAGSFVIEVLLDDSENVWRSYTDPAAPIAFAANVLAHFSLFDLVRQVRVKVTTPSASTITNAWVFSLP